MNIRPLVTVGLRLLAIWLILVSLEYLSGLSTLPFLPEKASFELYQFVSYIIPMLLYVGIGIVIFLKTDLISKYILPDDYPAENTPAIDTEPIATVLFSAVGLLIFIQSIVPFFNDIGLLLFEYEYGWSTNKNNDALFNYYQVIITSGLECLLGAVIFLGGNTVAKWWQRFRNWT